MENGKILPLPPLLEKCLTLWSMRAKIFHQIPRKNFPSPTSIYKHVLDMCCASEELLISSNHISPNVHLIEFHIFSVNDYMMQIRWKKMINIVKKSNSIRVTVLNIRWNKHLMKWMKPVPVMFMCCAIPCARLHWQMFARVSTSITLLLL